MAFEKRVPWSVFDVPGGGDTFVGVTIVPMGWSASVDLIQSSLRILVRECNLVAPECELRVGKPSPLEQAAVMCIDGFDLISKEPPSRSRDASGRPFPLSEFIRVANKLGLPRSVAKSVIRAYNTTILGGELDRCVGTLRHDRSKGHAFLNKTFALLSFAEVSQAPLQHWAGIYAFAAGFRRPLFRCFKKFLDS